jgi:4-amino-4-deoxy-L-arabinose transferase-like glycosyltransferase
MRRHVPAVAVGLVAVAVRLPGAFAHALWQDEVASARILAEPSLGSALGRVSRTESTPPLWYVLAWLAHHAGLGIRDVRLISVVAAGLLAALTCVLAARVAGVAAGVIAGLLVAFGEQFATYGESLRAYALFALLAVALALCVLRLVERPSASRLAAVGAVVAAGVLTHYFFVLSVAAALAWLWLEPAARAVRVRATAAIAVGAAALLPWLPDALRQYDQQRFWWIGAFRLRNVVGVPLRLYTFAFNNSQEGRLLAFAVFVAVVAACTVVAARSPSGRLVVAFAFVPVAVAGTAWAAGMKVWALRNLLATGPFAGVAVAAAIGLIPHRSVRATAAAAAVGALALAFALSEPERVPGYDTMARALVEHGWTAATPIAVAGDPLRYRGPLEWYLPGRPVLAPVRERSGGCVRVLVVAPSGRVVAARGTLDGVTLLADTAHLPRCVRRVRIGNAALA